MPVELTMHRNFTVRSTKGHTVRFEKGKPRTVPQAIVEECMLFGAVPAEPLPEVPDEEDTTPKTSAERDERIKAELRSMLARNDRDDFTSGGKPNTKKLEGRLGFRMTVQERDKLWDEVMQDAGAE